MEIAFGLFRRSCSIERTLESCHCSVRYRTLSGLLLYFSKRRFSVCHVSVPSMSMRRCSTYAHSIRTSRVPLVMLLPASPGLLNSFKPPSLPRLLAPLEILGRSEQLH